MKFHNFPICLLLYMLTYRLLHFWDLLWFTSAETTKFKVVLIDCTRHANTQNKHPIC